MTHLSPPAARRGFLTLTFTRWFPVGLTVAVLMLFQLERGQSIAETLTVSAVSGSVTLLLELPSSGFADGFGRRPVYLTAAVVNVAAGCTYLVATTFWMFAVGAGLTGIFRALDSGPLEAWYVDTVHLTEPGADVDSGLSLQSLVLGASVASGALLAGLLVWWDPIEGSSALGVPMALFAVLNLGHLLAVATLMREPASRGRQPADALRSLRAAPRVVTDGFRLLAHSRVLRGLVLVEAFWCIAMVVFEQLQPVRLSELLGDQERAATWMGPVAAAGWAVFALGGGLAGLCSRRYGVTPTAIAARTLNGLGAVVMGLMIGPTALVVAYLATYATHGAAGPVHGALLHREANAANRATILSINSMTASTAFAFAAPFLGLLATSASTPVAMITGGGLSLLGSICYIPALRQERAAGTRLSTARGLHSQS